MLILMNLVDDLYTLTTEQLCSFGYQPCGQDNPYDRFCMLYEYKTRHISPIPRKVEISRELRRNNRYNACKPIIIEIINRLRNGKDVTPYLSKLAPKFDFHDKQLLYWGIHHLHLSPLSTISNGFVNRADNLLFARIENKTAYLIDILPHAEPNIFEQKRILEIADQNWPHLHKEVFGITPSSPLNTSEIKSLRNNNGNMLEYVNNRTVMPTMGVTAAGTPSDATLTFDRFQIKLGQLESEVRRDFLKFFPCFIPPWMTHVRLLGVWEKGFDICEVIKNQTCRVQIHS